MWVFEFPDPNPNSNSITLILVYWGILNPFTPKSDQYQIITLEWKD